MVVLISLKLHLQFLLHCEQLVSQSVYLVGFSSEVFAPSKLQKLADPFFWNTFLIVQLSLKEPALLFLSIFELCDLLAQLFDPPVFVQRALWLPGLIHGKFAGRSMIESLFWIPLLLDDLYDLSTILEDVDGNAHGFLRLSFPLEVWNCFPSVPFIEFLIIESILVFVPLVVVSKLEESFLCLLESKGGVWHSIAGCLPEVLELLRDVLLFDDPCSVMDDLYVGPIGLVLVRLHFLSQSIEYRFRVIQNLVV